MEAVDPRPKRSPRKPDSLADICRDPDVMAWRRRRAKGGWPELTQINAEVIASKILDESLVHVVRLENGAALVAPESRTTSKQCVIWTEQSGEIRYEVITNTLEAAIQFMTLSRRTTP